jgi:hypothetical protein
MKRASLLGCLLLVLGTCGKTEPGAARDGGTPDAAEPGVDNVVRDANTEPGASLADVGSAGGSAGVGDADSGAGGIGGSDGLGGGRPDGAGGSTGNGGSTGAGGNGGMAGPDGAPASDAASAGGTIDASDGPAPTGEASCGMYTTAASRVPTDVLLVLDRSGSMATSISMDCCCDNACAQSTGSRLCTDTTDCTARWPAVASAVSATISQTPGINWGLKLFSSPAGSGACGVNAGVEVAIGVGSSGAIQTQIASIAPANNTPTTAAITAATAYLQTVDDQSNKVILLATDGEPNCRAGSANTSDVSGAVAAIQAALSAGFRVYVVGIGPSVGNLDEFARAGGTDHYFPAMSASDLTNALTGISQSVVSCAYTISQAIDDPANLAVYVDGKLVSRDPANGWSLGASSQAIVLNGSACTSVTSGASAKVQILFGCPGTTPPPFLP